MDRKIQNGCLSVNNAKDIIDKILFDNAGRIFNGTHEELSFFHAPFFCFHVHDIRQIRRQKCQKKRAMR